MKGLITFLRTSGIILFFILSWQLALSQHLEIDSLENTLNSKDDTVKVLNLVRLSALYQEIDSKKSFSLAMKAFIMAQHLSYDHGEYNAIGQISTFYEEKGDLLNALKETQQQLLIAEKIKDIRLTARSYTRIGNIYNYLESAGFLITTLKNGLKLIK